MSEDRARTTPPPTEVTRLLCAAGAGDSKASAELLPLVYEELRKLAKARLAAEPGGGAGYTLQPTALVHEAYLRLVGDPQASWSSRGHFFGAAALAIRRILVERARSKAAVKHGGARKRVDLDEMLDDTGEPAPDVMISLDSALERLEKLGKRSVDVVMLRCFAGLTFPETALALGVSERSVKDDWKFARAWLRRELADSPEDGAAD